MPFVGTLIDCSCIILFSIIGSLVGERLPERINRSAFHAIGICVMFVGIEGAFAPLGDECLSTLFNSASLTKFVILIISMVLGTAIGELIDIDKWVNKLGAKLEKKLTKNSDATDGAFARGFVSCTIMTCVGAMAVNGAILDATGDPGILTAKSIIDAISCFVMATSLGIGCAFCAVPVFIYQGAITLLALLATSVIPAASIYYLAATGSLIIILIGTNSIGATNVKTANMTPAVFVPLILVPIFELFS